MLGFSYVGRRLLVLLVVLMLIPAGVVGCGGEREAAVSPDAERIPVYVIADATVTGVFPTPTAIMNGGRDTSE